MGPTTTFLLEASPRGRLGFFGSWQLASQNMGSIISGLLGVILALALPADTSSGWGWRIPFLFGILIAPVGFYIRRNLPETLATEQTLASMRAVLSEILARHWLKVLLGILVISGATVSQYFLIYTTSYAIVTLGFPKTVAMAANLTIGVSGTMFAVLGGLLADRYGLKTISILPRLLLAVLLYPALMLVVAENSPTIFLAMVALLMALQAMSGAAGITLIPVIFPAATRTAGLSIAYAFGVSIFGGSAQFVFTWIINATGDKLSWVWYIVAMNIVSLLAVAALRVPRALAIEGLATQDARQAAVLAGARR
jgi:MFS family permease